MRIEIENQPYASIQADALVAYVFDKEDKLDGVLSEMDRGMDGHLAALAGSGELTGKALELVLVHFPQGFAAKRLLLVGAGKPGKFNASDLRKIAGAALRYLKTRGVKTVAFLAREGERGPAEAQAVVEGLIFADFESDTYRTEKEESNRGDSIRRTRRIRRWAGVHSSWRRGARADHRRIAKLRARVD